MRAFMRVGLGLAAMLAASSVDVLAQHGDAHGHEQSADSDTICHPHCLKEYFLKGVFHGHIRQYSMATLHPGIHKDYHTTAVGGAIHYESLTWHGIHFGLGGIFTYRAHDNGINDIDSLANRAANWEVQLYDIRRPEEAKDLDRLEELYIAWEHHGNLLKLGKQAIEHGPLMGLYDGRMKPFVYRAAWGTFKPWQHHTLHLAWVDKASPRGFTEWFSLNEAIGLTNNGYLPDGSHAHYHDHTGIRGVGLLGYEQQAAQHIQAAYWNYLLDRMMDIHWLQVEYNDSTWFAGAQLAATQALPHQKELEYHERYTQPNEQAQVASAQVGRMLGKSLQLNAAYLQSWGNGRFLFPRELGRETFYVSQSRARLDGLGNAQVVQASLEYHPHNAALHGLDAGLRASRWLLPDPHNYALNKYGTPSFYQLTAEVDYHFQKHLKGLEFRLLYVGRYSSEADRTHLDHNLYKTNFHHFNFVTNLRF